MRLPFSLVNPIGSQLSRKLLDLERPCISILNSSHIMLYWQILESPQVHLQKSHICSMLLLLSLLLLLSTLFHHHFPNTSKTTKLNHAKQQPNQPTNQPTPRVAAGRQVVSLCANLVANPRSFDPWISLMKLAPRSRNAGGKIWED